MTCKDQDCREQRLVLRELVCIIIWTCKYHMVVSRQRTSFGVLHERRAAYSEYKWVFVGCKPVVLSSPCPGVWLVAKEFTLLWLVGFESSSMAWAGPHSLQLPKLWESSLQITQNVAWCTKNEAKHHEKLAGISEYFWTLLWPVSVAAPIFCIILLLQQSHQMYSQDCSTSTKHYSTLCTANKTQERNISVHEIFSVLCKATK